MDTSPRDLFDAVSLMRKQIKQYHAMSNNDMCGGLGKPSGIYGRMIKKRVHEDDRLGSQAHRTRMRSRAI